MIAVSPRFLQHQLKEFDEEYSNVIRNLNLSEKTPDPTGTKAFVNLDVGELLRVMVNGTNHTWSLATEKYTKIITATEAVYDIHNTNTQVPITLKMAQTVVGKYQALSAVFPDVPMWLSFMILDINNYLIVNPGVNTEEHQERNFYRCARNNSAPY